MPTDRTRLTLAIAAVMLIALFGWIALDRNRQSAEVERLTDKLEAFRGDASAEIEQLESENSAITDELERTAQTRDELESQVADLSGLLEQANAEIESNAAIIEQYADLAGPSGRIEIMPDLLGETVEEAEAFAELAGATLVVSTSDPTNVIARPDTIIEQVPAAGTAVVAGAAIWVDVFVQSD
jgi:septal ring factor EnvC (AmiA/AmiB activator)